METEKRTVHPDQLLLDPNNYRFHDIPGYKRVAQRSRYSESGVQDRALTLLEGTSAFELGALKESIRSNGFIPVEQIVVEEFSTPDDSKPLFLVIEGNRRAAAVKILLADQKSGAEDIDQEIMKTLTELSVIEVIGSDGERKRYKSTLMAIRHVAGIREWGPYQQAKLVVELYDEEEEAFGAVAQRIGISATEVGRRYRASKALQQMEEDDEFSEYATPRLYSFFHEAMSQPKVREWLDFRDDHYEANDDANRRIFYELLSPRVIDGATLPPKLQNANRQVRQLKDIVDKDTPLKLLADPERPFEEAVEAAENEAEIDETGLLEQSLVSSLNSLRRPSVDAWFSPSDKAKRVFDEISSLIANVRKFMK